MPDLAPGAPSRILKIDAVQLGEDAPKTGTVTFTLLSDLRVLSTGRILAAGTVTVPLHDGKGQIRLPTKSPLVTDDCGDDWVILVKKSWTEPYAIQVPNGTSELMLGDLAPARPLNRREQQWAVTSASLSVDTIAADANASGTVSLDSGALAFRLRVPRGQQGLPGPGALAADDAVATYIREPSETSAALNRVYRRGYSPREFGVVGNGTANDTTAWRTAFESVPAGSTFYCPEGDRYSLAGPLQVTKAVTIVGGEFLPRNTGACLDITSSNVTIRGARFTSTTASPYEATHRIINAVGTPAARLRNITIDDVTIDKTRYIGVWLEWCEDVSVTRTRVNDFQYAGIMLISVTRGEVSSCVLRNGLQGGGIANAYGIAATDLVNTVAGRSKDILITRNIVDNIPNWEGIDTHGGERITITDNMLTRCRDGIAAVAGNASRVASPKDVVISGNTIDAGTISTARSGIRLFGNSEGEMATGVIGANNIRGSYVMPVEAANYDRNNTVISAQGTALVNGYASHPAPFRQWAAETRITRSGTSTSRTVTLPAGLFLSPPMVFLAQKTAGAEGWTWRAEASSATEVVIHGSGPTSTFDIQMSVWCIQMGTTAAGGVPRS